MVRPKKQSKRMAASKRYKIEKKVRDHTRKQRKEAKKSQGKHKRTKKDPGIPNLFPFKEQLLKQAEEKKLKQEEAKERRKHQRQKEINKRRNLHSLQQDALKRAKEFERKKALKECSEDTVSPSGGKLDNSLKAYYKEFKKVVDAADVILEVLDARDPIGCRCPQVEQAVLASGASKKLVLVLNKIDLIPKDIAEKWLKHLRNEFPTVAFKASTQTQKQNLSQSKVPTTLASNDLLSSGSCLGADTLLKLLGNYCRNKDLKMAITVGVVGFPNVGKSSIINSLKRCRACNVGATPGVTRSMQEIQLDKHVKLLDSPGIVMDSGNSDASIILRNCIKIETIDDPVPAVEAILRRCSKKQVMEKYSVPDYRDIPEFLAHLGKRLGKLKKGGVPDIVAAGKTVLKDWNSGKIVFYTHPPEQQKLPTHVSAEVVGEWSQAFDLDSLVKQEQEELHGLESKIQNAMVLESSAPVDAAEMDEEMSSDEDEEELSSDDENDEWLEEEDMEGSEEEDDGEVTVNLKKAKNSAPQQRKKSSGALKTSEMNEFNQQTNKTKKKIFKQLQKDRRKQGVSHGKTDSDAMVDSDDDKYNFDSYF